MFQVANLGNHNQEYDFQHASLLRVLTASTGVKWWRKLRKYYDEIFAEAYTIVQACGILTGMLLGNLRAPLMDRIHPEPEIHSEASKCRDLGVSDR